MARRAQKRVASAEWYAWSTLNRFIALVAFGSTFACAACNGPSPSLRPNAWSTASAAPPAPIAAAPVPSGASSASSAVFDVHEWGLVDVQSPTAASLVAGPPSGRTNWNAPRRKPVLYFHLRARPPLAPRARRAKADVCERPENAAFGSDAACGRGMFERGSRRPCRASPGAQRLAPDRNGLSFTYAPNAKRAGKEEKSIHRSVADQSDARESKVCTLAQSSVHRGAGERARRRRIGGKKGFDCDLRKGHVGRCSEDGRGGEKLQHAVLRL